MKYIIPAKKVNQLLVLTGVTVLAVLFLSELLPYLSGFLAAIALYVILINFQIKLEQRKWSKGAAAALLLSISTVIILIPLGLIALMLTGKIKEALANKQEILTYIQNTLKSIESKLGVNITENIDTERITSSASDLLAGAANSSLSYFIILGILYFVLYYMLTERDTWQQACFTYLPFKRKNIKKLGQESLLLIKSNAIGIPLVAVLQGVVAFIGFLIFGVEKPFFWFTVTAIGSMIPFVGTALGVVPATLILLAQDQTGMAIGFLIYGIVVVGSTDNLFRLVVQRKLANMHPLETLIGVIVGVPLFGFMGLIFGPVFLSLLLLLVRIYKAEYVQKTGLKKKTD